MISLRLFVEFFVTGLFAVGGGLATLPFLYDIGERTGWYTAETVADMLAISESTPGAIGANMATYTGYTVAGIPGGIVATMGLITPSVIVILIVARVLEKFRDHPLVENSFYGLRPASVGLIAAAGFGVMRTTLFHLELIAPGWGLEEIWGAITDIVDLKAVILAVVLFVVIRLTDKHPVIYIAGSAVVGVLFQFG